MAPWEREVGSRYTESAPAPGGRLGPLKDTALTKQTRSSSATRTNTLEICVTLLIVQEAK